MTVAELPSNHAGGELQWPAHLNEISSVALVDAIAKAMICNTYQAPRKQSPLNTNGIPSRYFCTASWDGCSRVASRVQDVLQCCTTIWDGPRRARNSTISTISGFIVAYSGVLAQKARLSFLHSTKADPLMFLKGTIPTQSTAMLSEHNVLAYANLLNRDFILGQIPKERGWLSSSPPFDSGVATWGRRCVKMKSYTSA